MALPWGQHKAQRVAQCVADGVNLGIEGPARDADGLRAAGLAGACRSLMRPAAGRIDHHLFHVGLLHALEKALEVPFAAPLGVALVHHAPFAQPLRQVAPGRARAGHPQQGKEKRPVRPARATFARWHERLDTLPLRIGEGVACMGHSGLIG